MKIENKGITLIALVITIIVLLILAGISIATLTGENGVITKTSKAKLETEKANVKEQFQLKQSEFVNEKRNSPDSDILNFLIGENYLNADYTVNISIVAKQITSGKGNIADKKDLYIVEDNTLIYYDKDGNKDELVILDDYDGKYDKENIAHEILEYKEENGNIIITGVKWKYRDSHNFYSIIVEEEVIETVEIPSYMKIGSKIYPVTKIERLSDEYGWLAFKNLIISDKIEYIEPFSMNITKLENITVDPNNAYYCSVDGVLYNKDKTILVSYPKAKNQESYTALDTTKELKEYSFYKNKIIKNINLPDTVEKIGAKSFGSCENLLNFKIPSNLKVIEYRLFEFSGISSIKIPEGVTTIENYAFEHCNNLTTVEIPHSMTSIESYCFEYSNLLTTIHFPNGKNDELKIPYNNWGAEKATITGI